MRRTFLFSLIAGLLVLAACQPKASTTLAESRMAVPESAVATGGTSGYAPAAELAAPSVASDSAVYLPKASGANEKIVIKTASMSITVQDVAGTMQQIGTIARLYGGDVVSSNLYNTTDYNGVKIAQGDITVNVKAEQLDQAMADIRALVADPKNDISYENISSEDVTSTYVDLQSRKRNYENAAAKLTELMEKATKTEDALNVFNQLVSIQEQIEVLQGQINYYEHSSKLSTITIGVQEKSTVPPITTQGWNPLQTLRDAGQSLVKVLQGIADFLMRFVIIFGPFIFILVFLPWWITWLCLKRKGWTRKGLRLIRPQPTPPPVPASPKGK
jgi:hypothetical protein